MERGKAVTSISIAMGTFNGAAFLGEQLDSLAKQTMLPVELQIGDDGSSDDTLRILDDFARTAPFPVTVRRNSANLGYGENFLQVAKRCGGDWVAFCDQDDVWLPGKLERIAVAIERGPADLQLVVHAATIATSKLEPIGCLDTPQAGQYQRLSLPPEWVCQGFRQVFRRSLFDAFVTDHRKMSWHVYPDAHDTWICLYAGIAGSVEVLDDPLVMYRRHESNTTEVVGLESPSLTERVRMLMANNSEHYGHIGSIYRDIAAYLRERAPTPLAKSSSAVMREAAEAIDIYGEKLATRSTIHRAGTLGERLRAFRALVRDGSYGGGHRWNFGRKAAVKDVVRMFVPGTRDDVNHSSTSSVHR